MDVRLSPMYCTAAWWPAFPCEGCFGFVPKSADSKLCAGTMVTLTDEFGTCSSHEIAKAFHARTLPTLWVECLWAWPKGLLRGVSNSRIPSYFLLYPHVDIACFRDLRPCRAPAAGIVGLEVPSADPPLTEQQFSFKDMPLVEAPWRWLELLAAG